jgi:hypothetical protein
MKKWIVLAFVGLAVFLVAGCGYQEGIREPDRQSYIWFTGKLDGAVAFIDDNEPFELVPLTYMNEQTGELEHKQGRTLYQVRPGKHTVMVKKNEQVVVHRELMIGSGATKEVWVP